MDKLFKIAIGELGQKEIQGNGCILTIAGYAKGAGFSWVNDRTSLNIYRKWLAMFF